jgi:hypothetical protein
VPQVPAEKSYFTFAGGLNTDASKIAFPEGSTSDESNYELLKDGSRRRRRGLALETGGAECELLAELGEDDTTSTIKWPNAGGSGRNFIVAQVGTVLYIMEDQLLPSALQQTEVVDLSSHLVTGKALTDISENPVSMDVGHANRLLVAGRYLEPFYVDFDPAGPSYFTTGRVQIYERDFIGIVDGVNLVEKPAIASASHTYNLRARGWKQANIDTYVSAKSQQPSKNMWPWKGYRRAVVGGVAEEDGTWAFSADKVDAELFGTTSAPTGHLIINPFDTTSTGLVSAVSAIEGVAPNWSGSDTVTITVTGHGLSNGDDITIGGNSYSYIISYGLTVYASLDGTYNITSLGPNTFTIPVPTPYEYFSFADNHTYGSYYDLTTTEVVTNPSPFITDERPTVIKWYAGRAWWMGIMDQKLKDKIYFSQITEDVSQYGKCYQAADPTDTIFNSLVASDGGFLLLPSVNLIKGAAIFNESLLIYTDTGVWEISGSRGVFAADDYTIRKVADVTATSPYSIITTSDSVYWTGYDGLYRLFQDPQTGFLTVQSISEDKVQTLWNNIPTLQQTRVKTAFDKSQARLYFLYQDDVSLGVNQYDACLVYSVKQQAYYKLDFPVSATDHIMDIFSITSTEEGENNKNIKFLVRREDSNTFMDVSDMDHDDFVDFDGEEQLPFLITGYDNLADFSRFKQAPVLHVFSAKTETGYEESGDDLVPINESSTLMRPVWDWADHINSNKFGPQQQVYRHRRLYQPVDADDTFDNGHPVVVTRNKLRGRGRVLHLRFDGEEAKDSHILGWSVVYKANRKV